jgi:hypothetical protein
MKTQKGFILIVLLLLSTAFLSLLYRIHLHCTSYYDLGIYSDALNRIRIGDLNPFLPGRNIRILNDHFDPILIVFSPFTRLLSAPWVGIAVEFLSLALCWYPLKRLQTSNKIDLKTAQFCYAFILLNHATFDAIQTPFHPTTWGVFPLVCVLSFYLLNEFPKMLASLIALYCCREEFPLIGLPLSWVLFIDRKRFKAFGVFALSTIWIIFVFLIRPKVFDGHFQNYGSVLLQTLFSDPLGVILDNFNIGSARMFVDRSLPVLLLASLTGLTKNWRLAFRVLLIASPILLIRFASNHWGFHYGTAAIISLLFIVLPCFGENIPRWRWAISAIFLAVTFISQPIKVFANQNKRCPNAPQRLEQIQWAQNRLASSAYLNLILENNLASTQFFKFREGKNIFLLGNPAGMSTSTFDAILVEKPDSGDPWPLEYRDIKTLIDRLRADSGVRVVADNEYIFMAEGKISIK